MRGPVRLSDSFDELHLARATYVWGRVLSAILLHFN